MSTQHDETAHLLRSAANRQRLTEAIPTVQEITAEARRQIMAAEAEEVRREATMPSRADMEHAVAVLCESRRGRDTMQSVLNLLDDHALGLDYPNQNAVLTLLRAAWGPFAGSTRECMADALETARAVKGRAR